MNTLKKLLGLLMMLSVVFFISCEDDEIEQLSTDEIKTVMDNLDSNMEADLNAILEAEGMEAMTALSNMPDPFAAVKSGGNNSVIFNIKNAINPLENEKPKSDSKGEPFNFADYTGTYTWVIDQQRWNVDILTQNTKIIIHFPTDETQTENNATLTIHEYTEQEFYDDIWSYYSYVPTKINVDLYINETKYVGLDFEASYDTDQEPTSLDLSVYLVPFEFIVDMNQSTTSASVSATVKMNNEVIIGAGITLELNPLMEMPAAFDGYLRYRQVKITGSADIEDIMGMNFESYESPDALLAAINEKLNLKIVDAVTGQKYADLEIVVRPLSDSGLGIDMVYPDGTREDAMPFLEAMITKIEAFMEAAGSYIDMNFEF